MTNVITKDTIYTYGGTENISDTFIGNINPFRYRSYYYDTDTKLYYLQSRYYDPEIGRFINADAVDYADPSSVMGLNLYAYCENDPVNYYDPSGHSAIVFILGWGSLILKALIKAAIFTITLIAVGVLVYYTVQAIVNTDWSAVGDSISSWWNGLWDGGNSVVDSGITTVPAMYLSDYYFSTYDPDPYRRPEQKKRDGSLKNKSRTAENWNPRGNKRRPKPPKKHKPKKDHQKYLFWLLFAWLLEGLEDN